MQNNQIVPAQSDDITEAFATLQNKNEIAEVLKELFDENKIFMIGDLTRDEIKLATRIYMIADMKNIQTWKQGLFFYCKLLLSRDRKSRREILDAIAGIQKQRSFLSRLNPFNSREKGGI